MDFSKKTRQGWLDRAIERDNKRRAADASLNESQTEMRLASLHASRKLHMERCEMDFSKKTRQGWLDRAIERDNKRRAAEAVNLKEERK